MVAIPTMFASTMPAQYWDILKNSSILILSCMNVIYHLL